MSDTSEPGTDRLERAKKLMRAQPPDGQDWPSLVDVVDKRDWDEWDGGTAIDPPYNASEAGFQAGLWVGYQAALEAGLWERIKEFNAHFDYKSGDELGLWAMIMRKQVEEIDEHLDNKKPEKAINEFIDCVLVGQQAVLLATDQNVDEVLMERILDIEDRVDDVEASYRGDYEREVRTDGGRVEDGTERYAYSRLTDTWYIVHDYEDLGDGKIRAKSKEEVDREDVPQEWIEAVDERPADTEEDR